MPTRRAIEYVKRSRLRFDSENPRLPADPAAIDMGSEWGLLLYIEAAYGLDELGQSMVDNGYFAEEPLLVVPGNGDDLVVVEGNRRLATLKLLTEPEARAALNRGRRGNWELLADHIQPTDLDEIPVIVHSSKADLTEYLGFRHISGVKRWSAEAKARYLTGLVRTGELNFRDAARKVGSTAPAVRRQVEAFAVLEQARAAELTTDGAERYFGLFYNALQDPGVRGYLSLPESTAVTSLVANPVADTERIDRLMRWLFGDRGRRGIIAESRDISKLGRVLANASARTMLLERGDFQAASRVAGGDQESMETALEEARLALLTANGQAFDWVGNESIGNRAKAIARVVRELMANLRLADEQ